MIVITKELKVVTFIFVYDVETLLKGCKMPNEFNFSSSQIIIFTVQLIFQMLTSFEYSFHLILLGIKIISR